MATTLEKEHALREPDTHMIRTSESKRKKNHRRMNKTASRTASQFVLFSQII
jgi:hypothetical protein